MKRFLPALLASAVLTLPLAACNNDSPPGTSMDVESDDVATVALPPLPPVVDTTGGKTAPAPAANSPLRELTAPNAVEDIKKMQPQM